MSDKTRKIEDYKPYREIVNSLQLKESDNIYLVSDISRLMMAAIQHEEKFRSGDIITAFTDFLSAGNLFIPGFVNTLEDNANIDMSTLKPETGGLSKEAFLKYKKGKCVRTNDPFHSFFIFGKDGERIVNLTYNNTNTFGENSVFGYLHKHGGILLIVDLSLYFGFTFAHYVEQQLKVSYRETKPFHFNFTDSKGNTEKKIFNIYAKKRGYIPIMNSLENPLKDAGALEKKKFNGIDLFKINLQRAYLVLKDDIENNKARNLIDFKFSLYLKQSIKKITG